jgi:hypothetical protein
MTQQYKLQGPAKKIKQNLALPRQLTIPALSSEWAIGLNRQIGSVYLVLKNFGS